MKLEKSVGKKILLRTTQNEFLYNFYLDEKRVLLDLNFKKYNSICFSGKVEIYKSLNCVKTGMLSRNVCAFFQLWSFENYTSKFKSHLRHKISCSFSPSRSTHLLLPLSSYPWLPMVVSFFLTHLLLEVAPPIIFLPSQFRCHWSSRSKGLHWWRRSKAYKLHKELRQPPWFNSNYESNVILFICNNLH